MLEEIKQKIREQYGELVSILYPLDTIRSEYILLLLTQAYTKGHIDAMSEVKKVVEEEAKST